MRHSIHRIEAEMPLAKVKTKFQVTIPTSVRRAAGLVVGDMLEASVEGNRIVMKRRAVVDPAEAVDQAAEAARTLGYSSVQRLKADIKRGIRRNAKRDQKIADEWLPLENEIWPRN